MTEAADLLTKVIENSVIGLVALPLPLIMALIVALGNTSKLESALEGMRQFFVRKYLPAMIVLIVLRLILRVTTGR